jgi:glucose/arabinose dehydrogenase
MRSLFAVILAAAMAAPAEAPASPAGAAATPRVIASNLHVPWGIAFLPDGDALVAERTTAKILRIPRGGGAPQTVRTLPGVDTNAGEGGLLGLAVSPHYRQDKLLFAYLTSPSDNRIVRFRLHGAVHPILTGIHRGFVHNGGRIAFGPDGKLYAGVGETGDTGFAQDRSSLNGKILRINPDGSVPKSNPFGSPVWTYGHRNVQGLAWDRKGRLWATEFGQTETDEVNLIRRGRNYGWPVVEGRGGTQGGKFTNPKVTWSPTGIASPSGAAIIGSRLYVGALAGEVLFRIPLHGRRAGHPKRLYADKYGRIRTVVRTPEGKLWFATSNTDGRGTPNQGDDKIIEVSG